MIKNKKIITPRSESFLTYIKKVWQYKGLALSFAKRDIQVKYAQTFLGVAWSIIQPVIILSLYTFFFGYILKWKSGNIPFPLYVFSGLIGWNLFQSIVIQGTNSLVESSMIIKKIYFPRFILQIGKVIISLIDLAISFALLLILLIIYGEMPSYKLIFLPFIIILNIICGLTFSVWISALSFRFRDLNQVVPLIMTVGIWVTPAFFTFDILPKNLQFIWTMNPMTGIIESWRWCLFDEWKLSIRFFYSIFFLIPLLISGIWVYSKNENIFSDYS